MTKHNNEVPSHFRRKKWTRRVRMSFDQPMKAEKRRLKRQQKAAAIFPRPVKGDLRPAVRIPSRHGNYRLRAGRGFSVTEVKEAGLTVDFARTIGISVDTRRRNLSEESLQTNVQRLKEYKAKLVLFPLKKGKPKKGPIPESAEDALKATQLKTTVLPITNDFSMPEPREIKPEERKKSAFKTLRRARKAVKNVGYIFKKKRAADEAAAATGTSKKAAEEE
jgi:large subunit ribosomal protein L13e